MRSRSRTGLEGSEVSAAPGRARIGELRTDAEAGTSDTVSDGREPCELRLVDCEVGCARALDALRVEDVAACGRGDRLDLDEAGETHRQ